MRLNLRPGEVLLLAAVVVLCGMLLTGVWLLTQPGGSRWLDREPPNRRNDPSSTPTQALVAYRAMNRRGLLIGLLLFAATLVWALAQENLP